MPRRYRKLILGLAGGVGLSRSASQPLRTPSGETKLRHVFDAARGLARISVDRVGADIATSVRSVIPKRAPALAHVDLRMNDAAIDHAVEQLRRSCFTFAAWLPGWGGHDVLRMQYVAALSASELSPRLVSPAARALLTVIRAERLDPE